MATGELLMFHVIAGATGLACGTAAMLLRKGALAHRMAGRVFSVAMLCMSSSSVYLACTKQQLDNVIVGALTFYLVATGWLALFGNSQAKRVVECVALAGVLGIAATASAFGIEASIKANGIGGGVASGNFYFMATIALCFAAFDARSIVIGGLSGVRRVRRHLWRLCLAMFMATLSVFVGQQSLFPAALRESRVLVVPVILVAAAAVYWLLTSPRGNWQGGRRSAHDGTSPAAKDGVLEPIVCSLSSGRGERSAHHWRRRCEARLSWLLRWRR